MRGLTKRLLTVVSVTTMTLLLFTGCEGASFTTTSVGNKTTIEAKEAEDGSTGETNYFSVGKDRKAVIDSSLENGELKIDFAEATVYHDSDTEIDDVTVGNVITSITVGAGDSEEIPLEQGDYVMQYTAIGTTNGKVTVNIEKE